MTTRSRSGYGLDLLRAHHDITFGRRQAGIVRNISHKVQECLDFIG